MSDTTTKLGELVEATLELAQAELQELQRLRNPAPGERPMSQKAERAHRVRVLNVMRALPALVKEGRQLAKDAQDWAANLTHEDKRRVVVEFVRLLPVEHQVTLLQELTRIVNETRRSA